jgi:signal transduction histidine kinase
MAIQTTREVALGLSSLVLNNSGYVDTIFNFTQSINELHKLTIDFTFNSKQRFSYLLEITLYRLTTELINNTLKYAKATHVEINYNFIKGKKLILFSYTDDGIGFDLADIEKTSKGLGLINIQHRLEIIGGKMIIEAEIGKGIKVYIELPVNEPLIKTNLDNKQKSVID